MLYEISRYPQVDSALVNRDISAIVVTTIAHITGNSSVVSPHRAMYLYEFFAVCLDVVVYVCMFLRKMLAFTVRDTKRMINIYY
jgi:hypothetical protein